MQQVWSAAVRYGECDQQGVVFNAHYLTYADEACTAWFAVSGLAYPAMIERGLDIMVKATSLEWTSPARWGDTVAADVVCERIGRTSFDLRLVLRAGERACCTVRTTYVLVGTDYRPLPVPDDLKEIWSADAQTTPALRSPATSSSA